MDRRFGGNNVRRFTEDTVRMRVTGQWEWDRQEVATDSSYTRIKSWYKSVRNLLLNFQANGRGF